MGFFGTDGFRGKAGVELCSHHAHKIGLFLGAWAGAGKTIVVGKDPRASSDMLECALSCGVLEGGANVVQLGVVTTPAVSFEVCNLGGVAGVMISASHNPHFDNGIKLFNSNGEKMDEDTIGMLEDFLAGKKTLDEFGFEVACGCFGQAKMHQSQDYINHLQSCGCNLLGLRVGLDCANGSASQIAPKVFETLGAEVFEVCNNPNGTNINDGCGSTHIQNLVDHVKKNKLDVGFAFDGDADRCIAVDSNGQVVDGDQIMLLCARQMQKEGRLFENRVVATVMSNLGFFAELERCGIDAVQTPVGDQNVYCAMKEGGYVVGGEQSGHVIFLEHARSGDGILTAIVVSKTMVETGKKLSVLACMKKFPQEIVNVRVQNKEEAMQSQNFLEAIEVAKKSLGKNCRVLVRPSGTEPVVRIMVEAKNKKQCQKHANALAEVLRQNS